MKIGMMADIYNTQDSGVNNSIVLSNQCLEQEPVKKARRRHKSPRYKLTRFLDRFQ